MGGWVQINNLHCPADAGDAAYEHGRLLTRTIDHRTIDYVYTNIMKKIRFNQ